MVFIKKVDTTFLDGLNCPPKIAKCDNLAEGRAEGYHHSWASIHFVTEKMDVRHQPFLGMPLHFHFQPFFWLFFDN